MMTESYKVSRAHHPEDRTVIVRGTVIGGDRVVVMAGPCAVESREQVMAAAESVSRSGAKLLRGGAFKPRTSPYAFQGMGEEGLRLLREAGDRFNLGVVTEVMDASQVPMVGEYADMFQIGARNMQNINLLRAVGKTQKPVLLKRGMSATIEEWLCSAEYIAAEGNVNIVLCERGIRTFEPMTRYTLDLSAIPVVRSMTSLPVIVDPSHATGSRAYVMPMARAAVAVGANGLIVEVHPSPETALCDGSQALTTDDFEHLMNDIRSMAPIVGMRLS